MKATVVNSINQAHLPTVKTHAFTFAKSLAKSRRGESRPVCPLSCFSTRSTFSGGFVKTRFRTREMKIRSRGSKLVITASFVETASQTASDLILSSTPGFVPGLCVNSSVFLLGLPVLLSGLTPAGVAHSWFLGTMVFGAFGARGYLLVCLYFILGSAVTKLKLKQKQSEGIAEARSGRRSPASVWGSGVAGVACAIAALSTPSTSLQYLFRIGFIASFTSKLSDTVSSEVGKAYGKTTYLSTTFKTVPRGTEGAVSLEGTMAGAGAAVVMATLSLATQQVDLNGGGAIVVAAVIANWFESVLGASVQGDVEFLTNDVINMIQITLAAGVAMGLYSGIGAVFI